MDFFANSELKNIDNSYAGLRGTLWGTEGLPEGICPGEELIANGENTLLQQVAEFYDKSQEPGGNPCYFNLDDDIPDNPEDLVGKFVEELTRNALPNQYLFH